MEIILNIFQSTFEQLFPTSREARRHKEVLRFMCGLIPSPEVLIEIVCERLLTSYSGQENREKIDDRPIENYRFIQSLCKELPQSEIDEHSVGKNVSCCRHGSFAFRPNRFYQGFYCSFNPSVGFVQSAPGVECNVILGNDCAFRWKDLYGFLNYVDKGRILISSLFVANSNLQSEKGRYDETVAIGTLRLSRNPQVLVCTDFAFPSSVCTRLAQQLDRNELKYVYLQDIKNLPVEFGLSLVRSKLIRCLEMESCTVPSETLEGILQNISDCEDLEVASFARTLGLPSQICNVLQCSSLEELYLTNCDLSKVSRDCILDQLASCGGAIDLKVLNLTGNVLSHRMSSFLNCARKNGGLRLEVLNLTNTHLMHDDLVSLAEALHRSCGHRYVCPAQCVCTALSALRNLDLSSNTLQTSVDDLLTPTCDNLTIGLESLWLGNTSLRGADIRSVNCDLW